MKLETGIPYTPEEKVLIKSIRDALPDYIACNFTPAAQRQVAEDIVDNLPAEYKAMVNAHDALVAALREIATHETGSTVGSEYVGTREVTEDCSECDAMQGIAKAALKAAGVQPVSVAEAVDRR
jgi:hypothetical protein